MFRLFQKPTSGRNDTAAFSFFILIPLLLLTLGCDVTDFSGEELNEISVPEPFKANVYIESLNDLEKADDYIFLHVVEADQKIDSKVRVDFNQLQEHGFSFPRERFGITMIIDAFMFQVTETTEEYDTLEYVYEQIHTAVIESIKRPYVHTDIGKFNYDKFYEDRGYHPPMLSDGDLFYPTDEDGILRSINY